jgi:ribosome-binding factor A
MSKHIGIGGGKSIVAELTEGDGIDPKEEKRSLRRGEISGKPNYAILRLASQIRDALDLAIPQSGHPLLVSFVVGSVEPSTTGKTFVAQVYSTDSSADYDPAEIKSALDSVKPRLRAEIAKEVTRKNAPDFKFDVLPPRVQPK